VQTAVSVAPNYFQVLLLADAFLPHSGGSREYYHNIYRELVSFGDTCVTVLTKKIPGWEEFDRKVCSEAYRIERRFRPLPSWSYSQLPKGIFPFFQALRKVLISRPSIIHAGDLYPPGVIAMTLKKLLGIPYAVYCHGEEISQLDRYRFQPRVRNRIYLNAEAVIANSEFTRQSLLRLGVPDRRIYKITPGVDSGRFKPLPADSGLKKRYGLEGKIVLLTVARLVPRKGHRLVLQAFSKIASEIQQAHYLIVGEGPEEQTLRELVNNLRLSERVTFAGHVTVHELPILYNLCDVMVMANRQETDGDVEGFGIVFLEASAVGKPVIGGRTGGAKEAIVEGTTGFLVDPDNADELGEILRRLLLDRELREKMGSAGVRRVRSEFNWRTRAELLRKINLAVAGQQDQRRKNRVA
jgi:phosphatidyl-myo-inositol dimannoside synthase